MDFRSRAPETRHPRQEHYRVFETRKQRDVARIPSIFGDDRFPSHPQRDIRASGQPRKNKRTTRLNICALEKLSIYMDIPNFTVFVNSRHATNGM